MNLRNRHLVAAITGILFSHLLLFLTLMLAEDAPPLMRFVGTVSGGLMLVYSMLMGVWGLVHERRREKEITAVNSVYPALSDIPFDLFKKHYLFIWYFERTPDPLPVRLHFMEDDVRVKPAKKNRACIMRPPPY